MGKKERGPTNGETARRKGHHGKLADKDFYLPQVEAQVGDVDVKGLLRVMSEEPPSRPRKHYKDH